MTDREPRPATGRQGTATPKPAAQEPEKPVQDVVAFNPRRSLRRRLAHSGFWSLVGRFGTMACVLINYRLVVGLLDDSGVATYVVALGVASLATLASASGLGSAMLRRMSHRRGNDIHDPPGSSVSLLRRVLLLAALSTGVVIAGLAILIVTNDDFFRQPIAPLLTVLLVWIAARTLVTLMTEALRGMQWFSLAAMSGGQQEGPLVQTAVMLALILGASRIDTIESVLWVHAAASWSVALVTLAAVTVRSQKADRRWRSGSARAMSTPPSLSTLGFESGKVLISQLSVFGIVEFETILIGRYCDDASVSVWGLIRRLIMFVSAPLLLVNAAIPSFVAQMHGRGEIRKMEQLLRASATLATFPSLVALVLLAVAGPWIFGAYEFSPKLGYGPLIVLASANVAFVVAGSGGLALRMSDRQGWSTLVAIALAVTYVVIAPWVIREYGILGAALLSSALVLARNLIATGLVRSLLGIWCFATLSPRGVWQTIQTLKRGKRKTAQPGGS